jgi:hypothetical protein
LQVYAASITNKQSFKQTESIKAKRRDTDNRLPVTGYQLPVTGYRLPEGRICQVRFNLLNLQDIKAHLTGQSIRMIENKKPPLG